MGSRQKSIKEELDSRVKSITATIRERDALVRLQRMNMWYWRDAEYRKHGNFLKSFDLVTYADEGEDEYS